MATQYIDQNAYPVYASVPATLGVNGAQDGDGLLPTKALSSVATCTVTGVAVAGDTISVMGVTLTAVASGATTAQFNVGASTSVQATNIATALNAAVGQVPATVSLSRHVLKNMIYAWASGSVVNIMTRAGSAQFNHATNANVAISKTGTIGLTIVQFAGGSSGAWAYFANGNSTIWPSAIAKNKYGAIYKDIGFGPLALTDTLTASSWTWIRANNSELVLNSGGFTYLNISAKGTFCVDNSTVWPGDTGYFKISSAAGPNGLSGTVGGYFRLTSKDQSRFIIEVTSNGQINFGVGSQSGQQAWSLDNVTLLDNAGSLGYILCGTSSGGSWYNGAEISYTRVNHVVNSNKFYSFIGGIGTRHDLNSTLISDYRADFSFYTGTPSVGCISQLAYLNSSGGYAQKLKIKNLTVLCPNPPYVAVGSIAGGSNVISVGNALEIENVVGCLPFATLGLFGSMTLYGYQESQYIRQAGVGHSRQFKLESNSCVIETSTDPTFPAFNSTYPDGTPHVLAFTWPGTSLVGSLRNVQGVEVFNWSLTVPTAGMTKVTLDFLAEPAIASLLTKSDLVIEVSYYDVNDVLKTRRSGYTGDSALLDNSLLTPTLNAYTTYLAKSIVCDITPPKLNSEIDVVLMFFSPAPVSVSSRLFINSEVQLSA